MASYFAVSVSFIILVPLMYSLLVSFKGTSESPVPKSPLKECWNLVTTLPIEQPIHEDLDASVDHVWIRKRERSSLLRPTILKLCVTCREFVEI